MNAFVQRYTCVSLHERIQESILVACSGYTLAYTF